MSNVRFVHFPARIVETKLLLWEPSIPGIWFRYHMETIANATYDTYKISGSYQSTLSDEDQNKLTRARRGLSHRSRSRRPCDRRAGMLPWKVRQTATG